MVIDKSNQVGTRHVEEVGGLLGREFCVHGKNGDGIAVSKLTDNLQEELLHGARKFDGRPALRDESQGR